MSFPYNISQNLIGYGVFTKHPSLSKTQTCEKVELTVSKNCDKIFSLMTPPFSFFMGPVDNCLQNPGKNTVKSPQLCFGTY